jgi:Helix-turn-helix domain
MAINIITQVEQKSQARRFTYSVLHKLACLHSDKYGYAYPTIPYLAKVLHASEITIRRHIHKLEELGEIIVERIKGGRGLNNRYYLKVAGILPRNPINLSRIKDIIQAKTLSTVNAYQTNTFKDNRSETVTAFSLSRDTEWKNYSPEVKPSVAYAWLKNPSAWLMQS